MEAGALQLVNLLPRLQDHGGVGPGQDEEGVAVPVRQTAPSFSAARRVPDDRPHVLAAGQLEGGDDLRTHAPLQNAQRPVLAVPRGSYYLDVGVGPEVVLNVKEHNCVNI